VTLLLLKSQMAGVVPPQRSASDRIVSRRVIDALDDLVVRLEADCYKGIPDGWLVSHHSRW
jgi:hypothetical protein